jgi:hypothetical protein
MKRIFNGSIINWYSEKEYCETNGIVLISIPYTYKKVFEVLKSILIDGQPLDIINQVEVKL